MCERVRGGVRVILGLSVCFNGPLRTHPKMETDAHGHTLNAKQTHTDGHTPNMEMVWIVPSDLLLRAGRPREPPSHLEGGGV